MGENIQLFGQLSLLQCFDDGKGPSIYYVIPDRGGGVCPIYYNITWGGSFRFITILHRGGVPNILQYYNFWGPSLKTDYGKYHEHIKINTRMSS